MEHIDNIKGVIFDYGGTIDSRGIHWSEIIWAGYDFCGVNVTKEQFRDSYVFAERELARVRHILPHHNFYDLLLIKMQIELGNLADRGLFPHADVQGMAPRVAQFCYDAAKSSIEEARPTLEELSAHFPMVLVSNFYGNVEAVLSDFSLRHYFRSIVESAVVGVRKPDPAIFTLGVRALALPADEVVVIGDSYKKDILPAEAAGCHAIWLKGKGWTADEDAVSYPNIVKSLAQIPAALL